MGSNKDIPVIPHLKAGLRFILATVTASKAGWYPSLSITQVVKGAAGQVIRLQLLVYIYPSLLFCLPEAFFFKIPSQLIIDKRFFVCF